jgi:hypothetical protein
MTNNETALLDMTFDEAQAKHNQLKSLHSAMRLLLLEMRDRKGWKALGFSSWEEYGEQEWSYSKSQLDRLATAARIEHILPPMGGEQIPERHLRPMAGLPEDVIPIIWQEANRKAEEAGIERTAKMVQEVVDEWKAKNVGEQAKTSNIVADSTASKTISSNEFNNEYAKEWGCFILEHSSIITAEQKKTYDAQRKFKKLEAVQDNLVQQGVEKTLTSVVMQMALIDSFLAYS